MSWRALSCSLPDWGGCFASHTPLSRSSLKVQEPRTASRGAAGLGEDVAHLCLGPRSAAGRQDWDDRYLLPRIMFSEENCHYASGVRGSGSVEWLAWHASECRGGQRGPRGHESCQTHGCSILHSDRSGSSLNPCRLRLMTPSLGGTPTPMDDSVEGDQFSGQKSLLALPSTPQPSAGDHHKLGETRCM